MCILFKLLVFIIKIVSLSVPKPEGLEGAWKQLEWNYQMEKVIKDNIAFKWTTRLKISLVPLVQE